MATRTAVWLTVATNKLVDHVLLHPKLDGFAVASVEKARLALMTRITVQQATVRELEARDDILPHMTSDRLVVRGRPEVTPVTRFADTDGPRERLHQRHVGLLVRVVQKGRKVRGIQCAVG